MMKRQRNHEFDEGDRWRLIVETQSQKVLEEYINGRMERGRCLGAQVCLDPQRCDFVDFYCQKRQVTLQTREL